MGDRLQIATLAVGLIQANCVVLKDTQTKTAIVVDAGGDVNRILVELNGYELTRILFTHAHIDHAMGADALKEAAGGSTYLHKDDKPLWDKIPAQGRMFGIPCNPLKDPDFYLEKDGAKIPFAGGEITVIHTPGHSPGSVCFYLESEGLLLTGDTIFNMGVGRTDLWGGDSQVLAASIRKLFTLPPSTRCITGHGSDTVIGYEKQHSFLLKSIL